MNAFVAECVAVLERTPASLRALVQDLPAAWSETRETPDGFSPRDVLGHLIVGEETDWVPRIRMILDKGDSEAFVPFDRFAFRGRVEGRPMADLAAEFADKRRTNLELLVGLAIGEAELARPGRHPALGTVTLRQLLATWVVHDLNHLGQIARVMARRHTEAVGPWRAYLGILG